MSVLIKGVKMPYSCLACPLQKWNMCGATGYSVYDEIATQRRRSDCPLVEIPTPHDVRENVKGKWVNNIHDIPICNQCGYMTPYDMLLDDYEYGNFCPNCGADMRSKSC